VHIRGTLDRLAYLLRSVVIGAYDVEAQGTQPTNLLSEHTFISSQGPILLGACYLADDGAQTWDALYEDLMKNHQTVYWAELAHAKSRRRKAQLSAVRWGSIIGGGLLAVFTCLFGLGVFQRISAYRTALKLANEALQKEELDTAETETANALTQFPGNGTAIGLQSRIIKIRSAAFSKSVRALLESQEFDAAQSQVSLALKRFPKDSSFSDLESRIKLARNPEFFRRYSSHEQGKYVYVVSISPLNEWIASGDGDGNIKVTELKTGIVKDSIKTGTSAGGLFNAVTAISFNLKSDMFISGNRGGEFVCWMIKPGGKLERRWGARRDADPIGRMASSVALSPDGQYALLANHAHSIGSVLVNTSDGVEIRRFKGGPNGTRQVKFISEDTFVAVDSDGHVRKWRKESAEKPIDDVPLLDEVKNVAVSNDGTTLVHSRNISISIYDIWSNKKIQEKDLSDVKSPEVSLSSDSAFAVIAGFPSRIIYLRAWADPARADFFQPLARSEKESSALRAIISVCFSQDGKYIAGGDGDGKLWVWQLSK
jgi:WD40 repeat protein